MEMYENRRESTRGKSRERPDRSSFPSLNRYEVYSKILYSSSWIRRELRDKREGSSVREDTALHGITMD